MKKIIILISIMAFVICCCSLYAAEAKKSTSNVLAFSGKVDSVDQTAKKIKVKSSKGTLKEFTVRDATKYAKGDKALTLADITAGLDVTVSYDGAKVLKVRVKEEKSSTTTGKK